jgi:hypothetical protein
MPRGSFARSLWQHGLFRCGGGSVPRASRIAGAAGCDARGVCALPPASQPRLLGPAPHRHPAPTWRPPAPQARAAHQWAAGFSSLCLPAGRWPAGSRSQTTRLERAALAAAALLCSWQRRRSSTSRTGWSRWVVEGGGGHTTIVVVRNGVESCDGWPLVSAPPPPPPPRRPKEATRPGQPAYSPHHPAPRSWGALCCRTPQDPVRQPGWHTAQRHQGC